MLHIMVVDDEAPIRDWLVYCIQLRHLRGQRRGGLPQDFGAEAQRGLYRHPHAGNGRAGADE